MGVERSAPTSNDKGEASREARLLVRRRCLVGRGVYKSRLQLCLSPFRETSPCALLHSDCIKPLSYSFYTRTSTTPAAPSLATAANGAANSSLPRPQFTHLKGKKHSRSPKDAAYSFESMRFGRNGHNNFSCGFCNKLVSTKDNLQAWDARLQYIGNQDDM